ncbi:glycerophosphodiester phosphodiesterase family protein [uncultured Roseobacter sp.]|uniref:glycerophosphodiester phosphodiesterase family protein n=1 Tax=uncultured Roseobacter sp. TaxID=114847 RepID=UPI002627EB87|nr:glycerophosphodiester phosphodiesterase family protein [uncultured Roseobacter sp.]
MRITRGSALSANRGSRALSCIAATVLVGSGTPAFPDDIAVTYGPRPAHLIDLLPDGDLKSRLRACEGQTPARSLFSIGHRGAALMFPEHTVESARAAARMGAGILECDVTFTQDHELVCRHAQNDLHRTTDILVSDLADTCILPFAPASGSQKATAECRTSEVTLDEFLTLTPEMDSADPAATTVDAYRGGLPGFRTTLYTGNATMMTHRQSIELFRELGAKFTPELKSPSVDMPHNGFSQQDYAQKLIDEYKDAGIPPDDVFAQSFNLNDVLYWIENEPDFGKQAVYLDGRFSGASPLDPADPGTFEPSMQTLRDLGVGYIAPPLWMLLALEDGRIVPSAYAKDAQAAGLKIITWTLERSGPLDAGGGWYFQTVSDAIENDGAYFQVLDVLAQDVGVVGVFSDWPATVTYYANCMGLP